MVSFCCFPLHHSKTLFSFHDLVFYIWCSLFGVNDVCILCCVFDFGFTTLCFISKMASTSFAFKYESKAFLLASLALPASPPIRPPNIYCGNLKNLCKPNKVLLNIFGRNGAANDYLAISSTSLGSANNTGKAIVIIWLQRHGFILLFSATS